MIKLLRHNTHYLSFILSSLSEGYKITLSCRGVFVKHDEGISAQSAANVLIIGLASEDCYVVLRTPHNDKEYVMQRSLEKATKASPHFSAVNVLIIGLTSEDCYVVLRTPHNDKEYVMQSVPSERVGIEPSALLAHYRTTCG